MWCHIFIYMMHICILFLPPTFFDTKIIALVSSCHNNNNNNNKEASHREHRAFDSFLFHVGKEARLRRLLSKRVFLCKRLLQKEFETTYK